MIRVHKIKLNPNSAQSEYFGKACGVARHAYNWALGKWIEQYEAGLKPSALALRREYNAIKPIEFPWAMEVTKCAPQQAIKNVGTAFQNFFRRVKQGVKGKKVGYPKFKKKGVHDSFRADNGPQEKGADAVSVDGKSVKLPVIGWVRMRESVRFPGQIKSAVVSKMADGWHVALAIETEAQLERKANNGTVGVDLGIKALAVLSNGETVEGPKPHKKLLKRLRRLNKSLSKKVKGSANWRKAKTKLAKLHKRIADIRNDAAHKLTTRLATEFDTVAIEDLNVSGMVQNHCLARSIMDGGFSEIRRQIEYKAKMTGSNVVIVDRWFPSSRTCSSCGLIHIMPLSSRRMVCDCGNDMDRDLNAARNLAKYAASSAASACGASSSGIAKAA
jgi:putative transposase